MGNQSSQKREYPRLFEDKVIITGDEGKWDANKVHTLSVVEANKDGYRYWGFYALCNYGGSPDVRQAGLIRSNDLTNWDKYEGNPIIKRDCRWPTVIFANSVFHMFYAEYDANNDSQIVMLTSTDGINFGNRTVVVQRELGRQNQNPFAFYNKEDSHFYLAYYSGVEASNDKPLIGRDGIVQKQGNAGTKNVWQIKLKKSKDIAGLKDAQPKALMTADYTVASPSIIFYKNRYLLLVEAIKEGMWDGKWVTLAFESDKIDGEYTELSGNPLLPDNDACAFQHIFDGQLYVFYSHCLDLKNWYWEIRSVKAGAK
jgi:hypothetical protein